MVDKKTFYNYDKVMTSRYNDLLNVIEKLEPKEHYNLVYHGRVMSYCTKIFGPYFLIIVLIPFIYGITDTNIPEWFDSTWLLSPLFLFLPYLMICSSWSVWRMRKMLESHSDDDIDNILRRFSVEELQRISLEIDEVNKFEEDSFYSKINGLNQLFSITVLASIVGYSSNAELNFFKSIFWIIFIFFASVFIFLALRDFIYSDFKKIILFRVEQRLRIRGYLEKYLKSYRQGKYYSREYRKRLKK